MFSPGETVSHQFIIPFVAAEVAKVVVSYKQDDDIVFEKTITSGFEKYSQGEKTIFSYFLTQQESLMFDETKDLYIQLNVFTTYSTRATSKPIKYATGSQYHSEVINNG